MTALSQRVSTVRNPSERCLYLVEGSSTKNQKIEKIFLQIIS